eukprot:scaffold24972_cov83-Isochrysis_galbana.AAC.2
MRTSKLKPAAQPHFSWKRGLSLSQPRSSTLIPGGDVFYFEASRVPVAAGNGCRSDARARSPRPAQAGWMKCIGREDWMGVGAIPGPKPLHK